MEINKFDDVVGMIPNENIAEGRFVLINPQGFSYDFGSRTDVVGCKLPATAEEAKRAKYILAFAQDNRSLPIYDAVPAVDFSLRQGWDQAANSPFSATVYMTHPGNMEGLTVASGTLALGYTEGVFTIPSGGFLYDADIIKVGAMLAVADTASEGAFYAGKLKYAAAMAAGVIGTTEYYDSTTKKLTVRIF